MRSIIREMFKTDVDEDNSESVNLKELEGSIAQFKDKLFKKNSSVSASVKKPDEHWAIETSVRLDKNGFGGSVTIDFSFQDLGQCLVKKIRELNGDNLVSGERRAIRN